MVLLLEPWLPGDVVLGSVLAYRIVYYLLPLAVAVPLFVGFEARERSGALRRAGSALGTWIPELVPRAFAATTFAAGVILLALRGDAGRAGPLRGARPPAAAAASGDLPPARQRDRRRRCCSSRARLQQRVDAAYVLTLSLLVGGAAASLLKGLDWEEALVLSAMAAALLPCRRYFYRRSALLAQSFSPAWVAGIALIFVATLASSCSSRYRHVELLERALVAVRRAKPTRRARCAPSPPAPSPSERSRSPACCARSPPLAPPPSAEELARAAKLVAVATSAEAHLALLGDKRLLFHESGDGFLMYGVQRRSWVAMGDPVGPREVRRELAWEFRELADQHGGFAVFYEVGAEDLPVYLDLGLDLRKLGEEARVPLDGFSLAGGRAQGAAQHAEPDGARRRALRARPARGRARAARRSCAPCRTQWLASKSTREKRFSLGFFDPEYLCRCPVAVVRRERPHRRVRERVGARDARGDLPRPDALSSDDAPAGRDGLPLHRAACSGGATQGYRWFGLGMAPLSGFEHHRLAPLWNRLGALLFRHGEHFYNFRGLRAFKDKFDPVWEPRYLASPGGLALPFVLTDVAALISGGVTGVVTR